jgi:hypothetical protein
VVRWFHWLAGVPFLPLFFDTALLAWTAFSDRRRFKAMERFETQVEALRGVHRCIHKYGGIGFVREGIEFGHLHGNGLLDVVLDGARASALVASGAAVPHHRFGPSKWVSFWIQDSTDIPGAMDLVCAALENVPGPGAEKADSVG